MKISKVGGPKDTASARKRNKSDASGNDFADRLREARGTGAASAPTESGAVGSVDAIYALQEVPDATDEKRRAALQQFGNDILDRLDDLRVGILNGAFSKDRLAELAQNLRQRRQESDDPKLNEIIEEIELRAEVEIAKLMRKPS